MYNTNHTPHPFLRKINKQLMATTTRYEHRTSSPSYIITSVPFFQGKNTSKEEVIRSIREEYLQHPTTENKLKFCAATVYSQTRYDPYGVTSLRRKLSSLRAVRLSDYLPNGEQSTVEDIIRLLDKGESFSWDADIGTLPQQLLGPAWEHSTRLYTPIPHEALVAGDPQTLRDGLNHDGTIIRMNLTARTKQTYTTVILPTLRWVCDVFKQHGVWGPFGIKPTIFDTLPQGPRAEVMRAVTAYHRVHHALTILGVMPNLSKAAPTLRPTITAGRTHLKQHPTVWEQHGPYSVQSALSESLSTVARDVVAITGGYTPHKIMTDEKSTAIVMRTIIDYIASVPGFTQDKWGKQKMVSVRSTARVVVARFLRAMCTESLDIAALDGLSPTVVFTVLGLSPQDAVYYTL